MGDVKLLAALGAWLGPVYILAAFALATVVASFMAVGVLLYHMLATGMTSTKQTYLATAGGQATSKPAAARRVLPFAVPLGVSTWLVLLWLLARQQGS
jgi:Flp pilus assembly protein protease CpaA